MESLLDALGKEAPRLISGVILLALAWAIGNRLTFRWNIRQKQRELDIAATHSFHALYGEFFATWKVWNDFVDKVDPASRRGPDRWKIFIRACHAEGRLEAALVSLACERHLTPDDMETLGRFRQLYQQLRQSIEDDMELPWHSAETPDYVLFKTLAPKVAALIGGQEADPSAGEVLTKITSNEWEPQVWDYFHPN